MRLLRPLASKELSQGNCVSNLFIEGRFAPPQCNSQMDNGFCPQ
jgi:hypothetical protein